MTDTRADDAFDDGDRLPWLEAVDEDEEATGPSPLKLIAGVIVALVAIGLIVGGVFWLGNRGSLPWFGGGTEAGTGEGELIAAPEGDYKVKPDSPGGMNVAGQGDTAFAASEGADPKGQLNTNAVPETPVNKAAPAPAQPQPKAAEPAQPKAAPPAVPSGPGGSIQLGAFSSQAGANAAWKALSGRFSYLAPLSHNVVPVTSGGRTLYRLRAGGPGAASICNRLRIAGESCVAVD
jgi:hypothetical protein